MRINKGLKTKNNNRQNKFKTKGKSKHVWIYVYMYRKVNVLTCSFVSAMIDLLKLEMMLAAPPISLSTESDVVDEEEDKEDDFVA